MQPKTLPSIGFAAGAGTLAYYFVPQLAAAGVDAAIGIAALSAVITPFAMVGKAFLERVTARIKGDSANA